MPLSAAGLSQANAQLMDILTTSKTLVDRATDAYASVYLLGRARSKKEMELAARVARRTEGARAVHNYVEVRP